MVNVARVMGLGIDPDDFPGTYPLFEAETRRRIWWEVFYYDLYVFHGRAWPQINLLAIDLYRILWVSFR